MSRVQEIRQAIDQVIDAHDRWSEDPAATEEPNEYFATALENAEAVMTNGDTPNELFELRVAFDTVFLEWVKFRTGHHRVIPRPDGGQLLAPHDSMWSAFRRMLEVIRVAKIDKVRSVESVKVLLEQKVTYEQIAKIYGHYDENLQRWTGVFFNENGSPIAELIEKEAANPKSVIHEGWKNPADEVARAEKQAALSRKLADIRDEIDRSDEKDRPPVESAEQMLLDGANVQQVMKVCNLDYDSVVEMCKRIGIKTPEYQDPRFARAPHEQETTAADDAMLNARANQPPEQVQPPAANQPPAEPPPMEDDGYREETIEETIQRLTGDGLKPGQIGKSLGMTTQKVVSILKTLQVETS